MAAIIFYSFWKRLDKKIVYITFVFIFLIVGVDFLKIFYDNLLINIAKLIALVGINFSLYFLAIKYLIDTQEKK